MAKHGAGIKVRLRRSREGKQRRGAHEKPNPAKREEEGRVHGGNPNARASAFRAPFEQVLRDVLKLGGAGAGLDEPEPVEGPSFHLGGFGLTPSAGKA